jgi:hypothetical protein
MLTRLGLYKNEAKTRDVLKGLPHTQKVYTNHGHYYIASEDAVWKHLVSFTQVAKRFRNMKITNMEEFRYYLMDSEERERVDRIVEEQEYRRRLKGDE